MTVSDLIDLLATLPRNLPVMLAADSEGNRYHPVANEYGTGLYASGELYPSDPAAALAAFSSHDHGLTVADFTAPAGAVSVVVLYPAD